MADSWETKETQTIVVSLPIEIISKILARLPVDDLTRFKTVSKAWYNLISSLRFSRHFQDRIFVFVSNGNCLYSSSLDISNSLNPKKISLPGYLILKIVGSCNGLLLCTCFVIGNDINCGLVMVNPSTMQHKLISKFEISSNLFRCCYGFGFDFEADDYKVVRILPRLHENGREPDNEVGVYSFKSDTWKIIDHDLLGVLCVDNGVLINNHMLHWLFNGTNGIDIRSFDVCTGQWSEVPRPDLNPRSLYVRLNVFDGHLCFQTHDLQSVFVMDTYGGQQGRIHKINKQCRILNKKYIEQTC